MSELNEQLHETTLHIDSALNFVEQGNAISDEAAYELSRLMHRAEELRVAAIRNDRATHTISQLCAKYVMQREQVQQIIQSLGADEYITEHINKAGNNLLELAPLAFTDVRGQLIVERMRQKIATGQRPGITVIGPNVTIRFSGADKNNLQSVSMIVVSVVDTSVKDEN